MKCLRNQIGLHWNLKNNLAKLCNAQQSPVTLRALLAWSELQFELTLKEDQTWTLTRQVQADPHLVLSSQ